MKLFKYQSKIFTLAILSLVSGVFSFYQSFISNVFAEETQFNISLEPAIEMIIPASVELPIIPDPSGTMESTSFNVLVGTNNITGYTLTMINSSTELINSTASATIPTLEDDTLKANFPTNRWGYSLDDITYNPIITSGTIIKTTDTNSNATPIAINLATKVNLEKPAGTYTNTINFAAVANRVPSLPKFLAALDAAQDGDTITLTEDIDGEGTVLVLEKDIIIDANGHSLNNFSDIAIRLGTYNNMVFSSNDSVGINWGTNINDSTFSGNDFVSVGGGDTNNVTFSNNGGVQFFDGHHVYVTIGVNSETMVRQGRFDYPRITNGVDNTNLDFKGGFFIFGEGEGFLTPSKVIQCTFAPEFYQLLDSSYYPQYLELRFVDPFGPVVE